MSGGLSRAQRKLRFQISWCAKRKITSTRPGSSLLFGDVADFRGGGILGTRLMTRLQAKRGEASASGRRGAFEFEDCGPRACPNPLTKK